jgi:uncharacterized protein (DUF2236 family)
MDERRGGAWPLPAPLQRQVDAFVQRLLRVDGAIDFGQPCGEPALIGPDSVSWQVFKNPLAVVIGGIAAVVLELAEPQVRSGVWDHTSFRERPLERLSRTGLAAMMTVYGPRSQTAAMIAAVTRRHARVTGLTPDGVPYRALDPELLDWVHVTASFGFIEAYSTYAQPLALGEQDRYYAEGVAVASLYGARAPSSRAAVGALFAAMEPRLEASPIVFEFLRIVQRMPALPGPMRPLQALLVRAAVELVPTWVRNRLGLSRPWSLAASQRWLVQRLVAGVNRLPLTGCPPVQACRRLGLPDDYLWRNPALLLH